LCVKHQLNLLREKEESKKCQETEKIWSLFSSSRPIFMIFRVSLVFSFSYSVHQTNRINFYLNRHDVRWKQENGKIIFIRFLFNSHGINKLGRKLFVGSLSPNDISQWHHWNKNNDILSPLNCKKQHRQIFRSFYKKTKDFLSDQWVIKNSYFLRKSHSIYESNLFQMINCSLYKTFFCFTRQCFSWKLVGKSPRWKIFRVSKITYKKAVRSFCAKNSGVNYKAYCLCVHAAFIYCCLLREDSLKPLPLIMMSKRLILN
jgi:hypothetical protein